MKYLKLVNILNCNNYTLMGCVLGYVPMETKAGNKWQLAKGSVVF